MSNQGQSSIFESDASIPHTYKIDSDPDYRATKAVSLFDLMPGRCYIFRHHSRRDLPHGGQRI
jgi:hypothetical protein